MSIQTNQVTLIYDVNMMSIFSGWRKIVSKLVYLVLYLEAQNAPVNIIHKTEQKADLSQIEVQNILYSLPVDFGISREPFSFPFFAEL